jgi:hypothetical protein
MSGPACRLCVMGLATKRRANRATHVLTMGDGLQTLVCDRHARMTTQHGANFAVPIPAGLMCAELSDPDLRDALQLASYERRHELTDAIRHFETIQRNGIFEAVSEILRRGVNAVGLPPPQDEERSPELEPPGTGAIDVG